MPHNAGEILAGKLRVIRELGAGGMGAVYEIEHEITKHRRALKLLHPEFKDYPNVVTRFLREASAAGRIGNAHIVETFDAGELDSGEPYLVMEFLKGDTLSDRLEKKGKIPLPELVELMSQACDGVQAAHDAGIVHRDLKPDNLFIVDQEGKPFLKILDFGISKFDAELTGGMGLTSEGSTLGTPYYMPPEQVRGQTDLDARVDVYALGVILYECASGRRPFEADTLAHLAVLIHEGSPTPLEQLRPDLPRAFVQVVERAMARERDERFPTASALREALAPFASWTQERIELDATMLPSTSGDTVAKGSDVEPHVVVADSDEARQMRAERASAPLAGSVAGSAVSVADEPKARSSTPVRVGVGLVAVAVLVGGAVLVERHASHSLPQPEASAAAAASVAPAPAPSPTVSVAPAQPPAAASAAPDAGAAPPAPSATAHAAPPVAARHTARSIRSAPRHPATTTGTSRAARKGLVNENPFK